MQERACTDRWPNSTLFFLKLLYPKHGTSWSVKLKFAFIQMWQAIYNSNLQRNNLQVKVNTTLYISLGSCILSNVSWSLFIKYGAAEDQIGEQ